MESKSAAKNAVIFSLVEQVMGKDGKGAKKRLEVTHEAIQLYDKHVNALGHAACMDAVKRYLGGVIPLPNATNGETEMDDKKAAKKQKRKEKRKEKKAAKKAANEQERKEKKIARLQRMPKMMRIRMMAMQVWKKEIDSEVPAEQQKFLKFVPRVTWNTFWMSATPNGILDFLKEQHTQYPTPIPFENEYDESIHKHVKAGQIFFKPAGYETMNAEQKKTELRNNDNWSNAGTRSKYKKMVRDMKAQGKVHKHLSDNERKNIWDKKTGQEKLVWLMGEENWENKIVFAQDETVMNYMAMGRVFFKPSTYRTANQEKRLGMHKDNKNWSNVNTKETWLSWKHAVDEATVQGKNITRKPRLDDAAWDAMNGQKRMLHIVDSVLVNGQPIAIATLSVNGQDAARKK